VPVLTHQLQSGEPENNTFCFCISWKQVWTNISTRILINFKHFSCPYSLTRYCAAPHIYFDALGGFRSYLPWRQQLVHLRHCLRCPASHKALCLGRCYWRHKTHRSATSSRNSGWIVDYYFYADDTQIYVSFYGKALIAGRPDYHLSIIGPIWINSDVYKHGSKNDRSPLHLAIVVFIYP